MRDRHRHRREEGTEVMPLIRNRLLRLHLSEHDLRNKLTCRRRRREGDIIVLEMPKLATAVTDSARN